MKKRIFTLFYATLLALVASNAQQNNFLERIPGQWSTDENFETITPSDDAWWHIFGDQRLDSLINVASKNNFSLIAAIENIRIAKAQWRQAQALLMPSIDLNAGWQRSRTSGNIKATGNESVYSGYFDAAADVSWQIDIFGKIQKQSKQVM